MCYIKYEIDCMIYELVDKKIKKKKVVKCRREGLSEKKKVKKRKKIMEWLISGCRKNEVIKKVWNEKKKKWK